MLDYMSNIMEDSHDFGWQAARASHAILLCKMEENKIDWHETNNIDHVRRVHAQKNTCHQKSDHEANGITYLHVCQNCFTQGKSFKHSATDCKAHTKNE